MSASSESSPALPETYRDCLDFLFARNQFSIKLGLETINALLDRLGRPDAGMIFLHVAGTNGKGSVCANLAALLGAAGYEKVGLYTSPHLVSFRERILVDGEPIPADWIVDWMRGAMPFILELNATYFECVTAMALAYFRFRRCGAVVLETGLGGRLDATNAVMPALTVITSISLDHTSILGGTVEAIWREKIAILKPGVPMVVMEERPHLLAELDAMAASKGSPVFKLGDFRMAEPDRSASGNANGKIEDLEFHGRYATYRLPGSLRPEAHQRANLALSLLAMETFLGRSLTDRALPAADALIPVLAGSRVPGRTQLLEAPGMLPVLLDGAHNPGGMAALEAYLLRAYPGKRIAALFSVMRDKDVAGVYAGIRGFASRVFFLPLDGKFPRALPYAELAGALAAPEPIPELLPLEAGALEALLRDGKGGFDLAVFCGSLYLLGEVIPMLLPHYRGLEWFRQFQGEA
jgi:dihydrofolate synthase / folylpolyglutamate synthase